MVEVIALNIANTYRLNQLLNLISPQKQKKLKSIKDSLSAQQGLASELLARAVICNKLGWQNSAIEFCYNDFGKPILCNARDFHFNLSHSGDWVVMAISSADVGIDIEQVVPLDLSIAQHFFSAREYHKLNSLPVSLQLNFFYQIWTLKESYIKMTGQGLSIALDSFTIQLEGKEVTYPRLLTENTGNIYFRQYDMQSSYKLAVCAQEDSFSPQLTEIDEDFLLIMLNSLY